MEGWDDTMGGSLPVNGPCFFGRYFDARSNFCLTLEKLLLFVMLIKGRLSPDNLLVKFVLFVPHGGKED